MLLGRGLGPYWEGLGPYWEGLGPYWEVWGRTGRVKKLKLKTSYEVAKLIREKQMQIIFWMI
jgi:hypothetical protein